MSNQPATGSIQKNSSLSDLIDIVKSTRDAFEIEKDLHALSSINDNLQQLKNNTTSSLQNKTKQVNKLRGKVNQTNNELEALSQDLEQSQHEAETYTNKDELFEKFNMELNDTEKKQEELRNQIDTITDELARLQTNEQGIKRKKKISQFNSDDTEQDGIIYDSKPDNSTLFDDIVVDEEDEDAESESDVEKDPDYYKLEIFKSMDIVVDPDTKEVFISRKDGKVDVLSLEDSGNEYFNNKFVWERLNMEEV
ncbi:kinetochore protein Spc24p [Monosporozyma unispora]|nr:kinetochore-associated Ndc80 complex subunit spc24 [Kazachstania unispora]